MIKLTDAELERMMVMDANLKQFFEFSRANPGAPLPWNEWAAAMIIAIAEDVATMEEWMASDG